MQAGDADFELVEAEEEGEGYTDAHLVKSRQLQDTMAGGQAGVAGALAHKKFLISSLVEMGFASSTVHRFVLNLGPSSLEQALEYLEKPRYGWTHQFTPRAVEFGNGLYYQEDICAICEETIQEHMEWRFMHNQDESYLAEDLPPSVEAWEGGLDFQQDFNHFPEQPEIDRNTLCQICCTYNAEHDCPALPCGHTFCKSCVEAYLETKISEAQVASIPCLQKECTWLFSVESVRTHVSHSLFKKFLKFREDYIVNTDRSLRWCPRPNCGRWVKKDKGKSKIEWAECECGQSFCFQCGQDCHPGKKCGEAVDTRYSEYARDNNVKRCPRCRFAVQKISGCNHMVCGYCQFEFCWLCAKQNIGYHFLPANFIFGCASQQYGSISSHKLLLFKFILLLFMPLALFMNHILMQISALKEPWPFERSSIYSYAYQMAPDGDETRSGLFIKMIVAVGVIIIWSGVLTPLMLIQAYWATLTSIYRLLARCGQKPFRNEKQYIQVVEII